MAPNLTEVAPLPFFGVEFVCVGVSDFGGVGSGIKGNGLLAGSLDTGTAPELGGEVSGFKVTELGLGATASAFGGTAFGFGAPCLARRT